jgi:AraC family transcriptional regulator of adaptative response / methylphosphotriester-DNA alkyltransferase methyltransferase
MTTIAAPGAELWITTDRVGRRRLLTARGRIDHDTARRLSWVFAREQSDAEPVALDLGAVEVADGAGTVLLLHAMRRLHARQRELIVVRPQPSLREALDRSGLARRFDLRGDGGAVAALPVRAATGRGGTEVVFGRLRASTAGHRAALLADATLAIERRHAEPDLSLHDIACAVATSDRQLQRVFAELAGGGFRDELAAVRMQHGAALLQTTELPVSDVARRVGYRQSAQFARAFRRHHGVAPTTLRRAARRSGCRAAGHGTVPGR